MRFVFLWFVAALMLGIGAPSAAQDSVFATQTPPPPRGIPANTWTNTPIHSGPSFTFPRVVTLGSSTPVSITARNRAGHWLKVAFTQDDTRAEGWVTLAYLTLPDGFVLSAVPVESATDFEVSTARTDEQAALLAVPLIPDAIAPQMCVLYREGVALGHNPYRVTKVGDSNSASDVYLEPLAAGRYDLAAHDYLQSTVELFAPHISTESYAARVGMNALSVFDPFWSASICEVGESPLACEYRLNAPSFAVMMFGINDTRALNSEQYAEQMEQLIRETLEAKIVPIVVLFTASPDDPQARQVERFNASTAQLAAEYGVPLINLWGAARELTNGGVGSDNVHLTASGGTIVLGEAVNSFGLALHHLLVLETLDMLRQTCGILPMVDEVTP